MLGHEQRRAISAAQGNPGQAAQRPGRADADAGQRQLTGVAASLRIRNREITPEADIRLALTDPEQALFVSDSCVALLGFAKDDFLAGRVSLRERIHRDDQDIAELLFATLPADEHGSVNIRLRQANGRIRCISGQFTKTLAPGAGGTILNLWLRDARSLAQQPPGQNTMTDCLRTMMEITNDLLSFKDRNHVYTAASQSLATVAPLLGHPTELIGKTDYEVFTEEYADHRYRLEKQAFASGKPAQEIRELVTVDSQKGWSDNRSYPIHDDSGAIVGVYCIARDISEQIRAEQEGRRLTAALHESEQRYRTFATATFEGIAISENGVLTDANDQLSEITGYSRAELIGRHIVSLVPANEREEVLANIIRNEERLAESELLRKDGTRIAIETHGRTLESAGRAIRLTAIRDISAIRMAEQKARASEARFRHMFERNDSIMLVIDSETQAILDANAAAAKFYGYSTEQLRTLKISQINTLNSDELAAMIASARQHKQNFFVFVHRLVSGELRMVEVRSSPILADGRPVLFSIIIDITERQAAETALLASKNEAEAAHLAKSKFLTATSHDLRHPLLTMNLFLNALAQTPLSDEQKGLTRHLEQSTYTLGEMLNALVEMARLDSGRATANFAPVAAGELFAWVDAEYSPVFTVRNLRFKLNFPLQEMSLLTDRHLLQRMLGNLIDNALKFCRSGGVLVGLRRRGGHALIQIWDTGCGIPAEHIDHIFEEYYQVGNEERGQKKGVGLGLSIVARQAQLIGATVRCRSRVGKGSVFEISLPVVA